MDKIPDYGIFLESYLYKYYFLNLYKLLLELFFKPVLKNTFKNNMCFITCNFYTTDPPEGSAPSGADLRPALLGHAPPPRLPVAQPALGHLATPRSVPRALAL